MALNSKRDIISTIDFFTGACRPDHHQLTSAYSLSRRAMLFLGCLLLDQVRLTGSITVVNISMKPRAKSDVSKKKKKRKEEEGEKPCMLLS